MPQTGKTAQEFIQHSFSPLVAVLSSPQVDSVVSRNHLTFVELLQPFCNLTSEGHIRDPSGGQCIVKNWRLVVRDVHWKPPPAPEARRILSHAVASSSSERTISIPIGNYTIEIPCSTPWLDEWREKYMEVLPASEHEFTKHFVACLLVGSTTDGDVSATFNALVQRMARLQAVAPPATPRWFNTNVLRSYVLLHDLSTGNRDKAERAFESLKQTYGAGNCFFLCINSRVEGEPEAEQLGADPWSPYVARRSDSHIDPNSNASSLPRTPVDARAVSSMPVSVISEGSEDQESFAAPTQVEAPHPLSPAEESDVGFDSANALQSDTLSGSTESVSSWSGVCAGAGGGGGGAEARGAALAARDLDALRQFLNDFAFKALLPYFERQISALHEAVANRKGVSRSLLSATKRWFGTNKPGTNTTINSVIYTSECPELQLRRLGDAWLLCGQWARAYDAYHTAKREFSADGAWLCYAGALEMAALSAFMADEPTRKTFAYMEESIVTYLNTCRLVQYAVRATLLSAACLASRGAHGEAARQLIRATSEEGDLRSAALLERAALCFAAGPARRAMPRKYAFHMVLAGNRYSKAGQKKHAHRCYEQAFQVYEVCGWRLAVDHVQFALGRLAGAGGLRRPAEAARWLAAPLAPHSPQPAPQQLALLREYILAHQQWMECWEGRGVSLPVLPLPLLAGGGGGTRVACGGVAPLAAPGRVPAATTAAPAADRWVKMEEMLLQTARGAVPVGFRPTITVHAATTDNTAHPVVPQGEPIEITIELENPLQVGLSLSDVELLWRFTPSAGAAVSNEPAVAGGGDTGTPPVVGSRLATLALAARAVRSVRLTLTPLHAGDLHVLAVAYKLCIGGEGSDESGGGTVIAGKQLFDIRGPRLKKNKDTPTPEYAVDRRLQIKVTPAAPCLQMTFSEINGRVLSGEVLSVEVELRNAGPVALRNLHLCVSHPACMSLVAHDPPSPRAGTFPHLYQQKYRETPANLEERVLRNMRWRECCARHVTRVRDDAARVTLLLRPAAAATELHLLAYYEPPAPPLPPPPCDTVPTPATAPAPPPYRLLRHTFSLDVADSVKIVAIPRRSIRLKGEECIGKETLNLAVEVKNISRSAENETVEVEVLEASLLSRQWRLTEFVAANTAGGALRPHEKVHLVLQGRRNTSEIESEDVIHTGIKINPSHSETVASVAELPYCRFVTDFPSPWDEDFDARGQGHGRRRDALIDSTLVVRWKARVTSAAGEARPAVGQHHLWLDCFTSKICSQAEGADVRSADAPVLRLFGRDEPPPGDAAPDHAPPHTLMYRLEHSAAVNHNFKKRKLCLVPVQLHLVNCHADPVTAHINLAHTSEKASGVGWTGAVGGSMSLRGFEARRVRACVAVAAPGAYHLADTLRVTCAASAPAAPAATSLLLVQQLG